MAWARIRDSDYVSARLHGRRSRLAETGRLASLCALPSLPDCARALFPDAHLPTAADVQHRLLDDEALDLADLAASTSRPSSRLLIWLRARMELEEARLILRRLLTATASGTADQPYVGRPGPAVLGLPRMIATDTLATWLERFPEGPLHTCLVAAWQRHPDERRPFLFEAALDQGWCTELLSRLPTSRDEEGRAVLALGQQVVDTFHLRLVARGHFGHGLPTDALLPLFVPGGLIDGKRFRTMLEAADLSHVASLARGRVIDDLPQVVTSAALENLCGDRLHRLARRAFRRSQTGPGLLLGFAVLRRIETANLITLTEGLRLSEPAEALRARMVPHDTREAFHV